MTQLEGRVPHATGAGRGIRRATPLALAAAGAAVVVAARSRKELDTVVGEIRAAGGSAAAVERDLSDRGLTVGLVECAAAAFGPGVEPDRRPSSATPAGTPRPRSTSPRRAFSKAVLPHVRAQGWDRIITIASINSRMLSPHSCADVASKHGVLGLMRTFALEHAAEGVTVSCVCPGPVRTRVNDLRIEYDVRRLGLDREEDERAPTPIGGRLEPDDVAPMVVVLAGEQAWMITGQAYDVDGGVCTA